MTRNIPGMPGHRSLTPAEKLAGAFAKEIRDYLTTQQLAHVVLRNKAYDRIHGEDYACATHDFIDSADSPNVGMDISEGEGLVGYADFGSLEDETEEAMSERIWQAVWNGKGVVKS